MNLESSHLSSISTSGNLDRKYYNVAIRYEDNSTGESIARFQEDRDTPILDKPNDWYMAITRFTINGQSIPIFIMDVIPDPGDPTNPNYTPYSFTFIYYTLVGPNLVPAYYTTNILYTPYNSLTAPNPPTAATTKKNVNRYYYVYAYQHMMTMMNTALATTFLAFKTAHAGATQTIAPHFIFVEEDSMMHLVTPFDYTEKITGILGGSTVTINRLAVCANDKLYNKCCEGIPSIFRGRQLTNGDDYQYVVEAEAGNANAYALPGGTIPVPPLDPDYLIHKQEANTLDQWNDVIDILFSTQTLPIYKEMVKSSNTNDGSPNFFAVITDFQPNLGAALAGSSILSYFQNGPYRLINLLTPTPLKTFDFQVYWRIKTGEIIPIIVTWNDEVSVRFMFARKSSFTS